MLPQIKTILYCTSLGPHAPYVFGYAYSLAKQLDARIIALHVIETLSRKQRKLLEGYAGQGELGHMLKIAHDEAARRLPDHMRRRLSSVSGEKDWERLVSEIIIAEGRSEKRILEIVDSKEADLVVIGAHTESSVLEKMIGSTARSLVKSCPVPVLTVQVPSGVDETANI